MEGEFLKKLNIDCLSLFFTTKKIGEGTGLGLALAYDIITNKHNGEIKASESEWKGARFTIKIPLK